MASGESFLIIAPSWVGDMVMAQTLFRCLRAENPSCTIDVLASPATASLTAFMPEVRHSFVLDIPHGKFNLKKRWQQAKLLRTQHYSQAIVLPNSWKSALIPFFAGIPRRRGWRGEFRYGLLNETRPLNKKNYPLLIERFAALAYPWQEKIPALNATYWPHFLVDEHEALIAEKKFSVPSDKPLIALCPGAEYGPSKRWPAEHFARVAHYYLEKNFSVALLGGKNDRTIADRIQQLTGDRCIDWVGKTHLKEAVCLLNRAVMVLTNDSGLMHVAAALEKPLVALYGSSSPAFTPPLTEYKKILSLNLACSPCFERVCPLGHLKCLKELMPAQAIQAMETLR